MRSAAAKFSVSFPEIIIIIVNDGVRTKCFCESTFKWFRRPQLGEFFVNVLLKQKTYMKK